MAWNRAKRLQERSIRLRGSYKKYNKTAIPALLAKLLSSPAESFHLSSHFKVQMLVYGISYFCSRKSEDMEVLRSLTGHYL